MFERISLKSLFLACVVFLFSSTIAALSQQLERSTISSIDLISDAELPESVVSQEQRDKHLSFDRDTATGLTLFSDATLLATLEETQLQREVRVYGSAPYEMAIFASAEAEAPIQTVDLTALSAGWNIIELEAPVITSAIRLDLTAKAGTDATELLELEFWGERQAGTFKVEAASQELEESASYGAWRAVDIPVEGGGVVLNEDAPFKTIAFDLPFQATEIRNAWLEYEARGDEALIALGRAFNGHSFVGGYPFVPSDSWQAQREQIDPSHLRAGGNYMSVALGASMGSMELRNARLVIELATGAKIAGSDAIAKALDADPDTAVTVPSGASVVEFSLVKAAELSAAQLSFSSAASGSVTLETQAEDGSWLSISAQTDLSSMTSGSMLKLVSAGSASGVYRLVFTGVSVPFGLMELTVEGSEVGGTWGTPELEIVWPVQGENYGTVGLVRGFVRQAELAEGRAQVFVGGLPVEMSGGTFEAIVSREQAGFANLSISQDWSVDMCLTSGTRPTLD